MANDQKMVAQMLDLSRSIEKLSSTVKKNTDATDSLSELQTSKDQKSPDLKPIMDALSGLKDLKPLTDELKKLDFGGLSKTLKETGNPLSGAKQAVENINPLKGFDVNKIIGAFQEGGIAKKDGNYLVGENGPEVVKLGPESAVIPLNIKDLMEGLKKIPELSKAIDGSTIKVYGDSNNPSVFKSPDISDLKNRIQLNKLSDNYEDKLADANDSKDESKIRELEAKSTVVDRLFDLAKKSVSDKQSLNSKEESKLDKEFGNKTFEQYKEIDKKWDEVLSNIPKNLRNDLSVGEAHNIALKQVLSEVKMGKNGKKSELEPDEKQKTVGEIKSSIAKELPISLKPPTGIVNSVKENATRPQIKNGEIQETPQPETHLQGFLKKIGGAAKEKVSGFAKPSIAGLEGSALSAVNSQASGLLKGITPSLGPAASLIPGNSGELLGSLEKKGMDKLTGPFSRKKKPESEPEKLAEAKNTVTPLATPSRTNEDKANKNVEKLTSGISDAINTKQNTQTETSKSAGTTETHSEPNKSVSVKSSDPQKMTSHQEGIAESINDIKAILYQISSTLSGTLEVTTIDSPFRPDSRKV